MVTLNCVRGHLHADPHCDYTAYQELCSELDIGNMLHIHYSLGYPSASLSTYSIDIYAKGLRYGRKLLLSAVRLYRLLSRKAPKVFTLKLKPRVLVFALAYSILQARSLLLVRGKVSEHINESTIDSSGTLFLSVLH